MPEETRLPQIIYSCYFNRSTAGEHFIPEHIFSYQISGTLIINDGAKVQTLNEGDFRLSRRNRLARFVKIPPEHGEFKSVSVFLDQQTLRNFSRETGIVAQGSVVPDDNSIIPIASHALYKSYIDSLMPYFDLPAEENAALFALKLKEAISLIIKINPELRNVLFDFHEPGKIDLESFMNKNFHFNVQLKRFAYLTGRSLATFKRDFEKIFHVSPSRWLLQKRLGEAYYQIKEQGKAVSEVYLELGFEDLSHFSYAFKKQYGLSPSRI